MEEQIELPGGTPAHLNPHRRPYTAEHKRDILQALAAWNGPSLAFCKEYRLNLGTLISWENAAAETEVPPKWYKKSTSEQRRAAVEAFFKAGLSFKRFS